jgi:hypothetical protein
MLAIAVLATELKLLYDDNFKVEAKVKNKREKRQKHLASK